MVDEEGGEGVALVDAVVGEGGGVEEEEMDVSSVASRVTFLESAPKQVEEEGDVEEGAEADSRKHFQRPRF